MISPVRNTLILCIGSNTLMLPMDGTRTLNYLTRKIILICILIRTHFNWRTAGRAVIFDLKIRKIEVNKKISLYSN